MARCGRLVKGYGSTRERGNRNLQTIIDVWQRADSITPEAVASLRDAALEDDRGEALADLVEQFSSMVSPDVALPGYQSQS